MGNRALQQWRSEDIPKTTCILSLHQQSQKVSFSVTTITHESLHLASLINFA